MVSIKDVAALAGVSDRTVSRVASGDTKLVRPKTRKKVLKAIEELGYVPNRAAQMMRTSRSLVIGLMTDVVATTPFSTDIVRGIQDALETTSVARRHSPPSIAIRLMVARCSSLTCNRSRSKLA